MSQILLCVVLIASKFINVVVTALYDFHDTVIELM